MGSATVASAPKHSNQLESNTDNDESMPHLNIAIGLVKDQILDTADFTHWLKLFPAAVHYMLVQGLHYELPGVLSLPLPVPAPDRDALLKGLAMKIAEQIVMKLPSEDPPTVAVLSPAPSVQRSESEDHGLAFRQLRYMPRFVGEAPIAAIYEECMQTFHFLSMTLESISTPANSAYVASIIDKLTRWENHSRAATRCLDHFLRNISNIRDRTLEMLFQVQYSTQSGTSSSMYYNYRLTCGIRHGENPGYNEDFNRIRH